MSNHKILFIIEGENDEPIFLQRLLSTCLGSQEYEIYAYKTNIHILSQVLYHDYPNFEEDEVDIKLVLKSLEKDECKRDLLGQRYRDVILIFDFEPQHDFPHFDTVRRMLSYFNDSTTNGKLYINYPMMQSYKHFRELPDDNFSNKVIDISELKNYKEIVGAESKFTNLEKYTAVTFYSLAVHHLRKAKYILTGNYELPEVQEYLSWTGIELYDKQCEIKDTMKKVFIVNTCIFFLSDFAPDKFLRYVNTHKNMFDI